jgi:hypothetical protein
MSTVTTDELYSVESYQLAIPGMDGYKADSMALSFSGAVPLDRTSADDLEFVNGLKLGQQIELKVLATVTKKGFSLTAGKDDNPDSTGYGVGLKVHSLEAV